MIASRAELEATKMSNLKQLVVQIGGERSLPAESKANLIDRILFEMSKQPTSPLEKMEQAQKENDSIQPNKTDATHHCTIEEVIKAVNPFILRGMKVFYNDGDDTWLFRVQIKSSSVRDTNTGNVSVIERWRDDSGTMKQPLATIKRCASILMQNAPASTAPVPVHNPAANYQQMA